MKRRAKSAMAVAEVDLRKCPREYAPRSLEEGTSNWTRRSSSLHFGFGLWLLCDGHVGGLAQDFAFRGPQALGDAVEANYFGATERRLTRGAIAVGPYNVMDFLP